MNKLIIKNKTDLSMKDILQMASQVTTYTDEMNDIHITTFYGGYACIAKRNKKSISLTFGKVEKGD